MITLKQVRKKIVPILVGGLAAFLFTAGTIYGGRVIHTGSWSLEQQSRVFDREFSLVERMEKIADTDHNGKISLKERIEFYQKVGRDYYKCDVVNHQFINSMYSRGRGTNYKQIEKDLDRILEK